MEVKQIYSLMNTITGEILGQTDVVEEDLTNIVDVGKQLFSATSVDNYVKTLVDHIGKVVFVNRSYAGNAPSVLMDKWEFGSVLEKIQADLPQARENKSWELTDGQTYDPNIFYKPSVSAKFFNSKVTFEIDLSFTEKQVKESFSSAEQLNGFLSMLYASVEKSMTVKLDELIMRTINHMIAETGWNEYNNEGSWDGLPTNKSTAKAVNLLYLFNDHFGTSLTKGQALTDVNFLKFAAYTINMYVKRLSKISTLFNIGGKARFTPTEDLHIVALTDFVAAADAYLESDVYHNELVALPNGIETIPYWQGSGDDYSFAHTSFIDVITESFSGLDPFEENGVLMVMFDRQALGVTNMDRRVTTNYNPKAEFYTNFYKMDAGYFNDFDENFVVFYIK